MLTTSALFLLLFIFIELFYKAGMTNQLDVLSYII
jgi:hypothetical protein